MWFIDHLTDHNNYFIPVNLSIQFSSCHWFGQSSISCAQLLGFHGYSGVSGFALFIVENSQLVLLWAIGDLLNSRRLEPEVPSYFFGF